MAIVVRDSGGNFTPAPAGQYPVVCCDVADLGLQETDFGQRQMIRLYWQTSELMEDGRPYLVTRNYTASLHEKSNLRRDLEAWRGVPFTNEELRGFDLERLIGVTAYVSIVHRTSKRGSVYANLASIMRIPKGMHGPVVDPEYVRWKDRQGRGASVPEQQREPEEPPPPTDDDFVDEIPF